MNIGHHFGPNQIYGLSLSLFEVDDIDFELATWGIAGLKLQGSLFGHRVNVASIEISDSCLSLGFLNCYLSVFWG